MTSYVENEVDLTFPFEMQKIVDQIMETVLEMENCPYETTVNLLLTDREGLPFCFFKIPSMASRNFLSLE